jgi:hypothetical protein
MDLSTIDNLVSCKQARWQVVVEIIARIASQRAYKFNPLTFQHRMLKSYMKEKRTPINYQQLDETAQLHINDSET